MAKKKSKEKATFADWVRANEKVLFVVLLAVLSFSFAFGPQVMSVFQPGGGQMEIGYGQTVGREELRLVAENLSRATTLAWQAEVLPGGLPRFTLPSPFARSDANPREFFLYREAAHRAGLWISDAELNTARHKIWRQITAAEKAREKLQELGIEPPNSAAANDQQAQMYSRLFQTYLEEFQTKLEDNKVFDPANWAGVVRQRTGLRPDKFEDLLRDVILLARLEQTIMARVQVSEKEAFDEFLRSEQRRQPSWVELEAPDALREKLRAAVTEEQIQQRYDEALASPTPAYRAAARIRFEYLRMPIDPFVAEAQASVTDEDVAEEYDSNLAEYVKPDIRTDVGVFALRTAEEEEARKAEIYLPLEDVKDKVRESAVQKKAKEALAAFGRVTRSSLHPSASTKPDDRTLGGDRSTFEAVAEANDAATVETAGFFTEAEAEEELGDLYEPLRARLRSWFTKLREDPAAQLDEKDIERLEAPIYVYGESEDGRGRGPEKAVLFLRNVELRGAGTKPLEEAREEVIDDLVGTKIGELLGKKAEEKQGAKTLAELVGTEVAVELDGTTYQAKFSEVHTTPSFVRSYSGRSFSSILVPKAEEEGDDAASSDDGDELPVPEEERHPSTDAIASALFDIAEVGGVKVARDESAGRVFLVRYEARKEPNPGQFEQRKATYLSRLEREAQDVAFENWRREIVDAAGFESGAAAEGEAPVES